MHVAITEYLAIDLDTETWRCRRCEATLNSARSNYKEGLLVYDRDPRDIHRPILDPTKYPYTYAPDPGWCRIIEYYCPDCGVMVEVEYLPPGHPPTVDMEWDLDDIKRRHGVAGNQGGEA